MLDLVVGWVLKPVRERDSVLLLDLGGARYLLLVLIFPFYMFVFLAVFACKFEEDL